MATNEKPSTHIIVEQVAETGKAYLFYFPCADKKEWVPKSCVVGKAHKDDGSIVAVIHNWMLEKHDLI